MEPRLQQQLATLESVRRRTRRWRRLRRCWAAMIAVAFVFFLAHRVFGGNSPLAWLLPLAGGLFAALLVSMRENQEAEDFPALVRAIEAEHPDLGRLLSTAIEQEPDASGGWHFLQRRVVDQVLAHPRFGLWEHRLRDRLARARLTHGAAFAGFLAVLALNHGSNRWHPVANAWFAGEIAVTPGDTEVERGSGLVVSARFGGRPPAEATLVLVSASGKTQRLPLARHLADPVFGASVMEVAEDARYHVEYDGKHTRDFKISIFDYPALVQADAALQFPRYTGLTNKIIRDTRRVSAVEGSRLAYTLQLNKPVARARFVNADRTLELNAATNAAVAMLAEFTLTTSAHYALELVDADGRTNRAPADFSIQVLTNRRPELKLVLPRGDQRVSSLEELQLRAEAVDDFGLLKYGIGFGIAGREPQFIELGGPAPANEPRSFAHLIAMEKLGVEVDQLVSYFAWADDYGPDGDVRRSFSDMFFAEVRPFEEIFRPDQGGDSGSQPGQQGGGRGTRLAELQKDIVIATWKLQRDKQGIGNASRP